MNYIVYYDILKSSPGVENSVFGLMVGVLAAIVLLIRGLRRRNKFEIIFWAVLFIGFAGFGSLDFAQLYNQHSQCQQLARSGDYQVVEGPVSNFIPYNKYVYEQFSVKNVHFEYSQYDVSACGFRKTIAEGSPIKDGLLVRIAYNNGRILKLEIAGNQ